MSGTHLGSRSAAGCTTAVLSSASDSLSHLDNAVNCTWVAQQMLTHVRAHARSESNTKVLFEPGTFGGSGANGVTCVTSLHPECRSH
eukprot:2037324-Rhodomonas_salina.1